MLLPIVYRGRAQGPASNKIFANALVYFQKFFPWGGVLKHPLPFIYFIYTIIYFVLLIVRPQRRGGCGRERVGEGPDSPVRWQLRPRHL